MKNTLMRSVVCLVLAASLVATGFAANKSRVGTAGAQELLIPVGARGVAMGPSAMVFSAGTEAIYWNPAGLGRQARGAEAMMSYMTYFADINVVYGAIGVKAGEFGTLGFTIKNIGFGKIPVTTETFPDGTGEQYSPTYLTLGVTYGKQLTDRISVGATVNFVSESILETKATGVAFNIGIQYMNLGVDGLCLGIAVKNIGPNMQYTGTDLLKRGTTEDGTARGRQFYSVTAAPFEMPSSMEMGVGYRKSLDDMNSFQIGGLFRSNNYQDDEYNLGAEYSFKNLLFLRGGYTFAPQADEDVTGEKSYLFDYTIGAGVKTDVGGMEVGFDYTYRHMRFFDGNHLVGLTLGF